MGKDSKSVRRLSGIVLLVVAIGMLIAGETALKARLDGLAFLIYWLICFGFILSSGGFPMLANYLFTLKEFLLSR